MKNLDIVTFDKELTDKFIESKLRLIIEKSIERGLKNYYIDQGIIKDEYWSDILVYNLGIKTYPRPILIFGIDVHSYIDQDHFDPDYFDKHMRRNCSFDESSYHFNYYQTAVYIEDQMVTLQIELK